MSLRLKLRAIKVLLLRLYYRAFNVNATSYLAWALKLTKA
jgi:hypothetical protein